jgi:hypothetical protein
MIVSSDSTKMAAPGEHHSERGRAIGYSEHYRAEQSNPVTVLLCPVTVVTVTTADCADLWHSQTP